MKRVPKRKPRTQAESIAEKVLDVATKDGWMEICFSEPGYGPCRIHPPFKRTDIRALATLTLSGRKGKGSARKK